ncbi:MAG: GNAT family N-acetyltransferase [Gemmatimonadota bacterium]
MKSHIRPAVASDSPHIARLLGDLGYPASPDAIPARLAALSAEGISIALVAEREGEVVGIITAHSIASIHDDEKVTWITTLSVSSAVRQSGVGRALVAAAESWAQACGSKRISVTTALHRAVAHTFYERLGYVQSGRRYSKAFS